MNKNSQKSTTSTGHEKRLSSDEVTAIIKCGRANKVAMLKYGALMVIYDELISVRREQKLSRLTDKEISDLQKQVETESFQDQEADFKQEQLEQMLIENPLEAERLLINSKLDEVSGGAENT